MPTSYTYALTTPASAPTAGADGASRPYAGDSGRAFLGFGLLTPFRRDQKGDFAAGGEVALVLACAAQVLGTECSTPGAEGELPWRPEFGSRLHLLRHRNIDDPVTRHLARAYAAEALEQWEPRFRLKDVRLSAHRSAAGYVDALKISVVGDVVQSNVTDNQVVVREALITVEVT